MAVDRKEVKKMSNKTIRTTLTKKSTATNQEGQYVVKCVSYRCFLQCLSWLVNPSAVFVDGQQESTFFVHLDGMYENGLLTLVHTDYSKNLFVLAGYLNSLRTE